MRGIVVDPFEKRIDEVDIDGGLESMYQAIGVRLVDIRGLGGGAMLVCDDEGLMKDNQRFFDLAGFPHRLAGKVLFIGCDDEGDTTDAPAFLTVDFLRAQVEFMPDNMVMTGITTESGVVDHPAFGKMAQITNKPHFALKDE